MGAIVAALALLSVIGTPQKATPHPKLDALVKGARKQILGGNFAAGIAALEEALKIESDPSLLLEIAEAYDEWGEHCAAALDTFRRFFEACKECSARDKATNDSVLVQNRCASDVTFETQPPGAVVRIETDDWSRVAPFTTRLKPGKYAYEVHRFGHVAKKDTLAVLPATQATVLVKLERAPGLTDDDLAIGSTARAGKGSEASAMEARVPAAPSPLNLKASSLIALGAGIAAGAVGCVFLTQGIRDRDRALQLESEASSDQNAIANLDSHVSRDYAIASVSFGVSLAGLALSALFAAIE